MSNLKLVLFSLLLLIFLSLRLILFFSQKTDLKQGDYLDFETTLASQPTTFFGSQKVKVDYKGNKITISVSIYPQFYYGDRVHVKGNFQKKEVISNKNDRMITIETLSLTNATVESVKNRENNFSSYTGHFLAVFFSFRQKLIAIFNHSLPPAFASLMLGITFGIKEAMPKDFLENLRLVGVMHVIAASGMNVTMTAGFFSSVTQIFFKRKTSLLVSALAIVLYAFLAGFEPSIVRASIMAIVVFSAQILGRQTLASYSLFLTAFLMLFVSPDLINNIGFQLFFLSTAGILYLQPVLLRLNPFKKPKILVESFTTTFSAQLATFPIIFMVFGTYSVWSLPVNVLVLWTIPYLMLLGAIGAFLAFIFAPLGELVLMMSLPLLIYFRVMVDFFAVLPGAFLFPTLSWPFAASYFCFLIMIMLLFKKQEAKKC